MASESLYAEATVKEPAGMDVVRAVREAMLMKDREIEKLRNERDEAIGKLTERITEMQSALNQIQELLSDGKNNPHLGRLGLGPLR